MENLKTTQTNDVVELNEGLRVPEILDSYKDYKFTHLATNSVFKYLYSTYGCPDDYNNGYTLHFQTNTGKEIEVYSTDVSKSFRIDFDLGSDVFDKPAITSNQSNTNLEFNNNQIRNVDIQTVFPENNKIETKPQSVQNTNSLCTIEEKDSFKKIFECLKYDKKVTFETTLKIPDLNSLKLVYENLENCKNEFLEELVEFIFEKNSIEDVIKNEFRKNIKSKLNSKTIKKQKIVKKD